MSGSYARVEDLKRKLRFLGQEISDYDLQEELEAANRRLPAHVGTRFIQKQYVTSAEATQTTPTFKLWHTPLLSFEKATLNDETITASNYTVDTESGTVVFESSYGEIGSSTVLKFYYVPEIFAELEVLLAAREIVAWNLINTTGDVMIGTKKEMFDDAIARLKNEINGRGAFTAAADHQVRQIP